MRLTDFIYKRVDDAGRSQRFSYVKELDRYHVLVVHLDHDRPCFIVVEKTTLKVTFVDYD